MFGDLITVDQLPQVMNRSLLWIVLLPLLGALINGVFGKRANKNIVTALAVGSVTTSFLLALMGFSFLATHEAQSEISFNAYEWFSITIGDVRVPVRVRFVMDHLSGIMTLMVTGIASLIHVYSIGYMGEDEGYARFMTYLNLFTASMLILVLASNFPLMFVGWEGVGLCSYLLIGFWYENGAYAAAGRKAFVVNRIGDFGVLIGMFLLVQAVAPGNADAFEFSVINDYASSYLSQPTSMLITGGVGWSIATFATLVHLPRLHRQERTDSRCSSGSPTRWRGQHRSPR